MMHRTRSVAKKEREMENICRPHRYQFVLNPEKTPITDRGKSWLDILTRI